MQFWAAELQALPAARPAETLQTTPCRCCTPGACEYLACEWRASIDASLHRKPRLNICVEGERPHEFPLTVPALADPAQATWWVWCLIACWWWRVAPPKARSHQSAGLWLSPSEGCSPGCTAPLAESQTGMALAASVVRVLCSN